MFTVADSQEFTLQELEKEKTPLVASLYKSTSVPYPAFGDKHALPSNI